MEGFRKDFGVLLQDYYLQIVIRVARNFDYFGVLLQIDYFQIVILKNRQKYLNV